MEAELKKELGKTGIEFDDYVEWLISGEIVNRGQETLAYSKVLAEKGPDIVKKHCAGYIGWILDCMIWANGLAGGRLVFA